MTGTVPAEPRVVGPARAFVPGVLLVAVGIVAIVAPPLATLDRWPLPTSPSMTVALAGLLAVIVTIPLVRPSWGIYVVFFSLPLFGNRPGGRYMELISLIVGASIVGLSIDALRRRLPFPRHHAVLFAWMCVISSGVALVPALPGILERWGPVNDVTIAAIETLTSMETDPFYSICGFCLLVFAVSWATALVWSGAERHTLHAFTTMVVALLLTTGLGILDYHRIIDLDTSYLLAIDPRALDDPSDDPSIQSLYSIFWNPGWFAWYFSMSFGVALGLTRLTSGARRHGLLVALGIAYAYFLSNRQRGGFVAVHVALLIVVAHWLWHSGLARRRLAALAGAASLLVVIVAGTASLLPDDLFPYGLRRLLERPSDQVRSNLAATAFEMWREAPMFGIGEGAFAWRYREFVPVGSPQEVITYGDAHNTWLQVLATRGLFGFLCYIAVWAAVVGLLVRGLRSPRSRALPAAAALGAFFVYSFVQGMFYLQAIQVLFWGIVALLVAMTPQQDQGAGRRLVRAVALATACALALALGINGERIRAAWQTLQVQPRGFYPIEPVEAGRVGRWSSKRGTLCFYPEREVTIVDLQAMHPDIADRPVTVTLAHRGTVIDRVRLASAARVERRLALPLAAVRDGPVAFGECRAGAVRLTVEVERVWTPLAFGLSDDPRHLGVFVSTDGR